MIETVERLFCGVEIWVRYWVRLAYFKGYFVLGKLDFALRTFIRFAWIDIGKQLQIFSNFMLALHLAVIQNQNTSPTVGCMCFIIRSFVFVLFSNTRFCTLLIMDCKSVICSWINKCSDGMLRKEIVRPGEAT